MQLFRLAKMLGKTVSELDMTWREFIHWQAYLMIEPPDKADNERLAVLLAQITNMAGRSLPNRRMVKPADFLEGSGQTAEDQIAFMKSLGDGDG